MGRPDVLFLDEPSAEVDRARASSSSTWSSACVTRNLHHPHHAPHGRRRPAGDYVYIVTARWPPRHRGQPRAHRPDSSLVMTITVTPEQRPCCARPPWRRPDYDDVRWVVGRAVTLAAARRRARVRGLTASAARNDTLPEALSMRRDPFPEDVFLDVAGRDAGDPTRPSPRHPPDERRSAASLPGA
ncbi:hypothetical protein QJS66_03035 [Kocuria rhizophila]|nr:hypothetical protein QJS66_03035 [Kocuria rhizophila]